MPIEGIIAGLKEIADTYNLGKYNDYVKDAVEALTGMDSELDKAFNEGKMAQLEECFEMALRVAKEV